MCRRIIISTSSLNMISLQWQIYDEVSSHSLGFCSGNSAMPWRYKTLNKSEVINATFYIIEKDRKNCSRRFRNRKVVATYLSGSWQCVTVIQAVGHCFICPLRVAGFDSEHGIEVTATNKHPWKDWEMRIQVMKVAPQH